MRRVAAEHAAQQFDRLARRAHATARSVRDRHDAVDVRVVGQDLVGEVTRDHPRDVGRAVHARQDANVVARRDAAVGAVVALEHRGVGDEVGRTVVGAERVVALEGAHAEVVHVDMLARADRTGREADDLVVAADGLAFLDVVGRDLVTRGDGGRGADVLLRDFGAGRQVDAGDDHVVGGIEADDQIGGLQHGVLQSPAEGRAAGVGTASISRRSVSCALVLRSRIISPGIPNGRVDAISRRPPGVPRRSPARAAAARRPVAYSGPFAHALREWTSWLEDSPARPR